MLEILSERVRAAARIWREADERSTASIRTMVLQEYALRDCLRQAQQLLDPAEYMGWVRSLGIANTPASLPRAQRANGIPAMPLMHRGFDRRV
jgi:hypothetical protein